MFIINYLLFLAGLNYIPTPEGAIDYTTKILVYMVLAVFLGTLLG
jgi:drug/metabolite transporter (DMT)-like permease